MTPIVNDYDYGTEACLSDIPKGLVISLWVRDWRLGLALTLYSEYRLENSFNAYLGLTARAIQLRIHMDSSNQCELR